MGRGDVDGNEVHIPRTVFPLNMVPGAKRKFLKGLPYSEVSKTPISCPFLVQVTHRTEQILTSLTHFSLHFCRDYLF